MKRPRSPSASPEANDEPHQPQPAKKSAIKQVTSSVAKISSKQSEEQVTSSIAKITSTQSNEQMTSTVAKITSTQSNEWFRKFIP